MVPKNMPTHFKTPEEIAARKAFIAGVDAAVQGDKWSFTDLKRLSKEDLLSRLESVDNQATLMRWRIWWAIRQQFKSDKLFGQYIAELKENSTYANLVGSQQDINRALNAGRFCELHNITSLDAIGLLKSSVYALSRPVNADVADKIFHAVKRKNLPNTEVERMIFEAKSITVDNGADSNLLPIDRIAYDKAPILVKNNIAQLPEVLEQMGDEIEDELLQGEVVPPMAIEPEEPTTEHKPTLVERRDPVHSDVRLDKTEERRFTAWVNGAKPEYRVPEGREKVTFSLSDFSYDDLLLELASRDASHLNDEQKISEMVLLDERFKLSPIKLIGLHQNCSRDYQAQVYKK